MALIEYDARTLRAMFGKPTFAPLELQRFFERTLFNFAIGNGDAHRKNFSLLTQEDGTVALSPAYDLVSSRLAILNEREELALTLNGKRSRLDRRDFFAFADDCTIDRRYAEGRITQLLEAHETLLGMIATSQLRDDCVLSRANGHTWHCCLIYWLNRLR